jgi:DNA-binding NarL/FixJ family response regulator
MDRVQVLVVDDHQLVIEAIRTVLDDDGGVEIVGEALSGAEALAMLEREQPDIVLLDLRMPGMNGLECLDQIRARFPAVRVVFLSGSDDDELALEALERGASAFVSKNVEPRDLSAVLRQVVEGSVLSNLGMAIEPRGARAARKAGLTPREGEVLAALAEGRPNKQIARQLHVSEQAVKYHLTNIYRKLETPNRVEALRRATVLGLVDPYPPRPHVRGGPTPVR